MKSVLILGGSGYIGSETCKQFNKVGYRVVNVDKAQQHHYYADWYQFDLTEDPIEVLVNLRPKLEGTILSAVICFAAYKDLPESYKIPFDYYNNNFLVLINGLNIARYLGAKKFIFSSSAGVYSDKLSGSVNEFKETSGNSPYGYTKLVGERIVIDSCSQFGIPGINLRYFNPIGKTEVSEDNSDSLFGSIKRCLENNQVANVFGSDYETRDGSCIRDYIDLRDLVDAHKFAVESIDKSDTYNVGNGKGVTVLEVMDAVKNLVPTFRYKLADRRIGDAAGCYADTQRINELGWKCKYSLEDSIKTFL